jgi:rhodanese-related sulfurtransferase
LIRNWKKMKKLIAVIFASTLALTSCGGEAAAIDLNPTDFQAKAQEAGVVLLDVRTSGEFAAGHIEGAINIDVEGMTFEGEIASLDKSKTYAIYCQSGRRSRIAVETMNEAGFTKLFNLDQGIGSWQAAGLPVVA